MKKTFTILCGLVLAANLFAQLPYNTTLTESHYGNNKVVVQKEGTQKWEDGVRLGTSSWLLPGNWDDKYIVIALNQQSIPYQLSFKCKITTTMATQPDWYVEESADNTNWSRVWTASAATTSIITVSTDWATPDPLTLSKSTKYVKICYSGNYSGIVADIKVTDQAYVNNPKVGDNEISSLDFGSGTISSGEAEMTFDVEWCNVPELSVTSDNAAFFAVSPASFGGTAKYGTQTISVKYNRDKEVGDHTGTITLSNGSITKTVTVSGSTTKRTQEIHWAADLEATSFTLNAEDALTGAQVATADNTEAEVTFATDNAEVIAVSADGKTLSAVTNGTATITVTATGNAIYNEAQASQLFTVTADKKQIISWDQNFMSLKTNENPKTIELTATSTSGGLVTYALEAGSDACVTLSGENNAKMTITGTPGVAYVIATQAGGEINGETWIAATARKQIKVRDPQSACDEYALADESYTFPKEDKNGMVYKEFSLVGKPTNLTFKAKRGNLKYAWESQDDLYIEQYSLGAAGMDWKLVAAIKPSTSVSDFGPYALEETATKIRFRTGEYAEQAITNISIPRKKELAVSETAIVEDAENNVRWSKVISVSRSNVDVVDITVDAESPFKVSKTSIGTDCADRGTETFEVSFTPTVKDSTYTGTIVITDGKATPMTHTISLQVTAGGFKQSINNFELPATAFTTDTIAFAATATSDLEVVYLSSDSTIAYVEKDTLVILKAGTVDITAYQAGDDQYRSVSQTKTIALSLTPVTILVDPSASEMATGDVLSASYLADGQADVEGTFVWTNGEEVMDQPGEFVRDVTFVPANENIYDRATTVATLQVVGLATPVIIEKPTTDYLFEDDVLGNIQLIGGKANVAGTFAWTASAQTVLVAGKQTLEVLFTPTNTEGYKTVKFDLEVTVYTNNLGAYEAQFCQGDSVEFEGVWYKEATQAPIPVIVSQKTTLGRDSTVLLTVVMLPTSLTELNDTLTVGETLVIAEDGWKVNNTDLPAGSYPQNAEVKFDLIRTAQNIYGCDSVIIRHIVVEPKPQDPSSIDNVTIDERAYKEFRNGVLYIRRGDALYTIEGRKVK